MLKTQTTNRVLCLLLVTLMVLSLAACGSSGSTSASTSSSPASTSETSSAAAPVEILFASGSAGGAWAQTATMFSDKCQGVIPNFSYTIVPGGGASNVILVSRGECNVGMTFLTNLSDICKGIGQYAEEFPNGAQNLRVMCRLGVTSWGHIVISEANATKYNIKSFQDVVDQKIPFKFNVGNVGQGDELFARRMLEAYGVTYEDIESWGGQVTYSPNGDAIDRFVNGNQCDVLVFVEKLGLAEVTELFSSRDCVLVSIDDNVLQYLADEYNYVIGSAPADTYKGMTGPFDTVFQEQVVFCRDDMDEELIYQMTKTILENKEEWMKVNASFSAFDPANAYKGIPCDLHPGAERAYKELGLM